MADKEKPAKAAGATKEGAPQKAKSPKGAKVDKKAAAAKAPATPAAPRPKDYKPRMKAHYEKVVRDALLKKFEYKNTMQVPRIEKIVLNMGVGEAVNDRKKVESAAGDLALIAGQRPVQTRSRKAIANYKLREGMQIGAKVTLRGDRMYEFVDKLFSIALPRIKDFKGISERQFDGRGNLNIGVREQLIFPEIEYDKVEKIRGMDITLVTTARDDEQARELLKLLGLPLREGTTDRA